MQIRKRDVNVIQHKAENDPRIDDILNQVAALKTTAPAPDVDLSEIKALVAEALSTKTGEWQFDVERDDEGRISRINAKQVRTRLI